MREWSELELNWLKENYPKIGKAKSVEYLNRSESSVRWKAGQLGIKQDRKSEFFKDWQNRAKISKIGKKRPEQALVIKKLHAQGKLLKTDVQRKRISERMQKLWLMQEHPRGMLGKKHNDVTKQKIAVHSRKMWEDSSSYVNSEEHRQKLSDNAVNRMVNMSEETRKKMYSNAKRGFRQDIGIYVRSGWEANYARYLNFLISHGQIKSYEYEPETFWFHAIQRGCRTYLPDFKIMNNDGSIEYHEVKGYMDAKSKTKIKRMAKYYPNIKLIVIDQKTYNSIKKIKHLITNWED